MVAFTGLRLSSQVGVPCRHYGWCSPDPPDARLDGGAGFSARLQEKSLRGCLSWKPLLDEMANASKLTCIKECVRL